MRGGDVCSRPPLCIGSKPAVCPQTACGSLHLWSLARQSFSYQLQSFFSALCCHCHSFNVASRLSIHFLIS
ncbi:hypothetical protein HBI65_210380 [Parastagonospora nodorum]|nr:hypothetical protein HBH42_167890 [Parastagonospora nodorum]KAH5246787.1 hypothetical protein HBI71_181240 [Parastagonospora nodorum]KAH5396813.1 hypothetical protein HBI47_220960 [Parastagonospora nodorum]KAH5429433.1 hypothetical protein HBI32_070850 [Parastagonospora nodorum]KAH5489120.1 hypothetical protein HBI31_134730 [Parastagonospora nodorum]